MTATTHLAISNRIVISVMILAITTASAYVNPMTGANAKRGPTVNGQPGLFQISGRSNSALINCAAAISAGSLEGASHICRAWVLTMIKNRNDDVQRLVELALPEDHTRGMQEIKNLAKAFKKFQEMDGSKLPSRPEGAYFYSPSTNTWERIRF